MSKFLLFIVIIAFVLPVHAQQTNVYRLVYKTIDPNQVSADAMVYAQNDTFLIHPACPNYDYPEGWSTFIKGLKITDSKGVGFEIKHAGKNRWVAPGASARQQPLHLTYSVDLKYAQVVWEVGNEQAGFFDGKTLYSVTKPFFITASNLLPSQVYFDVPQNWSVATPWEKISDNQYRVKHNAQLIGNSFMLGKFNSFEVKYSKFTFVVASHPNIRPEEYNQLSSALKSVLAAHQKLFNEQKASKYLISIFHANQDDGEAFDNSMAFTQKDKITSDNKINWANQLSHELFHYWNGHSFEVASGLDRWFQEGFSEYYSNLALIRTGVINKELYYQKAQFMLAQYIFFKSRLQPRLSLDSAGLRRAPEYRFGVYNGGWVVAMSLDMMIRGKSKGKLSLDDFMAKLYATNAENENLSRAEIINVLNSVIPNDYKSFFDKYVSGSKVIPINDYLKSVGLFANFVDFQGELYLTELPKQENRIMRDKWLHRE